MHDKKQPFELDVEWLIKKSKEKNMKPPTENSLQAFAERVSIGSVGNSCQFNLDKIRESVFLEYLWGNVGDMPEMINGE